MQPNSARYIGIDAACANTTPAWRMFTLSGAVALMCALTSMDASALALGRITVQSALGEPLRAEIDIAEINASEAASLQAKVASLEAFKAAGIEFTPVLSGLAISLQRRADGRSYFRLSGSRPVSEPFVDMILEVNWPAGRVARDYTMLFDPPGMRSNPATAPVLQSAPMVPRPIMPAAAPTAPPAAVVDAEPAVIFETPQRPPAYRPPAASDVKQYTPPPRTPPARSPLPPAATSEKVDKVSRASKSDKSDKSTQVTVQPGDTAGRIAMQNKSGSVSLDQMLVALLRENPDAFIRGNVNRIKSGAVLQIPGQDAVAAVAPSEARQTIVAQSADFNAFRRKLSTAVPTTSVTGADRQASGKVQAKVEDRAPASSAPDKLALSKGAVAGRPAASAEQQIANARQSKDAAARVAELSKNISDLNKLGAASSAASTAATTSTVSGAPRAATSSAKSPAAVTASLPATTVPPVAKALPTPPAAAPVAAASTSASAAVKSSTLAASAASAAAALATASSPAPSRPASAAMASASGAALPAVKPAASAAATAAPASAAVLAAASAPVLKPQVVPTAPAAPETSLFGELLDNPLVIPGVALLLALLGGLAFYRNKKSKEPAQVDSSFLESRLQPDSFFGASGGQRVDTNDGNATGSSLVYSPSQLDAAGDVDPVAEADVYLAYGRDLQAEEILKEALRTSPMRVAIHAKLLEIYAKRHDVKAFGVIATEAFKLTRGEGSEWHYITEMGRELDPNNAMYQPGGQPQAKSASMASGPASVPHASSGGFGSSTLPQAIEPQYQEPSASVDFDLDLDFSMDEPAPAAKPPPAPQPVAYVPPVPAPAPAPAPIVAAPAPMFDDLEMDFGDSHQPVKPSNSSAGVQKAPGDEPLEFDSISLSDDASFKLPARAASSPAATPTTSNAPLEFDMGALSLDLDGPITESSPHSGNAALEDPLETKFSLAQEFRSLGDPEGARALAEEVLLEAKGALKIKAQAFINSLS